MAMGLSSLRTREGDRASGNAFLIRRHRANRLRAARAWSPAGTGAKLPKALVSSVRQGVEVRLHRRRSGRAAGFGLLVLACTFLGGILGAAAYAALHGSFRERSAAAADYTTPAPASSAAASTAAPAPAGNAVIPVVQRVGPAVVSIDTLSRAPVESPFGMGQEAVRQGLGSGFIIDGAKRLVVTNITSSRGRSRSG